MDYSFFTKKSFLHYQAVLVEHGFIEKQFLIGIDHEHILRARDLNA